ncbi:MAG: copper amine oxidase N-terminal domain-containing protein [Clostridiales Family XIII bacterium]|nr:copper amine oxidase N-terminal domain-containing protein [Clostridiales Family XIII bacterium]
MNRDKLKGFTVGFTLAALLFGAASAVFASVGAYPLMASFADIRIFVDGKQVDPRDANGASAEPFIINGTTYLPVRAVAEALGMDVSWDNASKSVRIVRADEPTTPAPQTKTPVSVPVPPAEAALKQWLSEKGADFRSVMEAYFGEGTKVFLNADGSKLVMEISKATKAGILKEERLRQEEAFIQGLTGIESDYQQLLDLIRADTGYDAITMDIWHYFDENLIYTQEIR